MTKRTVGKGINKFLEGRKQGERDFKRIEKSKQQVSQDSSANEK